MKIAILGTGGVGSTLGTRWAKTGHAVIFGSREPKSVKVQDLLSRCGAGASAALAKPAALAAEVVLLAVPWSTAPQIVAQLGDLGGRVLIDCTNPLAVDFSGIEIGHSTSAAEEIARWSPAARVVKAFNTASSKVMADPEFGSQRAAMFFCGDDSAAKEIVKGLIAELDFDPIDAGPLTSARYLEPLAMLYIHLAFKQGWGSNCAFQVLKR